MDTKRHSTAYPGVHYRLVDRIGGKGPEKMFYIRFKKDGRVFEEKVGRALADRMTAAKAARIRADRIEGRRQSRKEIRNAEKKKAEQWTIGRLATVYFESLEHNPAKSRKALSIDRNRYENFIKPGFANKMPAQLLPLDIERLRRELQKTNCKLREKAAPPRTLAPATIRATLSLLKRVISYGSKNGYAPRCRSRSPCRGSQAS